MKVVPDPKHRIVLTRKMREALNLNPGDPVEVSIFSGAVILSGISGSEGKVVRKGKLKVYTGKIPNIDVEDAVIKVRHAARGMKWLEVLKECPIPIDSLPTRRTKTSKRRKF